MQSQFIVEFRDAVGDIRWLAAASSSGIRRLTADCHARSVFSTSTEAIDALADLAPAIRSAMHHEVIQL